MPRRQSSDTGCNRSIVVDYPHPSHSTRTVTIRQSELRRRAYRVQVP